MPEVLFSELMIVVELTSLACARNVCGCASGTRAHTGAARSGAQDAPDFVESLARSTTPDFVKPQARSTRLISSSIVPSGNGFTSTLAASRGAAGQSCASVVIDT